MTIPNSKFIWSKIFEIKKHDFTLQHGTIQRLISHKENNSIFYFI